MTNRVPLGTGSIVGDRFVFEEQIGRGGMGTVFKARDLRKEEARDADSRVAVKILNEEFKRHPNAMQALQREARKAQSIAHPNIVTVYDFDRDGPDVYMTMELLEGVSLDRVIKDVEGLGVGFKEALRIMGGVCDAMSYAHDRGIVHADFKPANVFLTREGTVKVLDFGIARAVKSVGRADGPHTLFDPGELGALTPAYAGYEVIEGQDPDVRDDIYAIACVFYELLTGKHPFNRLSAEDASKANLSPARPRGFSRLQWQVLRSALEFRRAPRPASAAALVQGLTPKRKAPAVYFGLAVAASVVIVAMLAMMHVTTYRDRAVSSALVSDDAARIESVMPWLQELTPERRATLFLDEKARAGLVKYFTQRVDVTVDPEQGRYDYAQADALIKELWGLLPDSQTVKTLVDRVSARRSYALKRQSIAPTLVEFGDSSALAPDTTLEQLAVALKARSSAAPRSLDDEQSRLGTERSADSSFDTAAYASVADDASRSKGRTQASDVTTATGREQQTNSPQSNQVVPTTSPSSAQSELPPRLEQLASQEKSTAPSAPPKEEQAALAAPKLNTTAQLAALKKNLLSQVAANQVHEATATLSTLQALLPQNDAFLMKEAPEALALSYLRLASTAAKNGRIEDALSLAESGAQFAPTLPAITAARDRYARYIEIDDHLQNRDSISKHHIRFKIWRVAKLAPAEMPAVRQRWERDLKARIRATDEPKRVAQLSNAAQAIFGSDAGAQAPVEQVAAETSANE